MSCFNDEKYLRLRGLLSNKEITEDMLCPRCGYNLRGLKMSGRCPECGEPISLKLRGDEFMLSPGPTLSRLHLGAWLIVGAWLGLFLIPLISFFARTPIDVTLSAQLAGALAGVSGTFLICSPLPGDEDRVRSWKSMTPWTISAAVLGLILTATYAARVKMLPTDFNGTAIMSDGVVFLRTFMSIVWLGGMVLTSMVAMQLANKAQDQVLVDHFRRVLIGIGCFGLFGIIFQYVAVFIVGGNLPTICLGGYFIVLFLLAIMFYYGWSMWLLRRLMYWTMKYQVFDESKSQRLRSEIEELNDTS